MKKNVLKFFGVIFIFSTVMQAKASSSKPIHSSMIVDLFLIKKHGTLTYDEKILERKKLFSEYIGQWGSILSQIHDKNKPSAITDDWLGNSFALNCKTLNEAGEENKRLFPLIERKQELLYPKKNDILNSSDLIESNTINSHIIYSMDYHTLRGSAAVFHFGYKQNFIVQNGMLVSISPYQKTHTSDFIDNSKVQFLKYDNDNLIGIIKGRVNAFSRDLDKIIFCQFVKKSF